MKKLNLLIVALLALALILTACQPAPTPTEAMPEETEEMAVEETEEMAAEETEEMAAEETEEVVEEPTDTEGPAPAADDNWCSGTKIVFFPGGSPGGPFETVVYNGAVVSWGIRGKTPLNPWWMMLKRRALS
jgi:hypothetical protein